MTSREIKLILEKDVDLKAFIKALKYTKFYCKDIESNEDGIISITIDKIDDNKASYNGVF